MAQRLRPLRYLLEWRLPNRLPTQDGGSLPDYTAFKSSDGKNDNIGVNWGDCGFDFQGLQGYSDVNCRNTTGAAPATVIWQGVKNQINWNWQGPNTCERIGDFGGADWLSVKRVYKQC